MATYAISGVWKDNNDVITHYAMHSRDVKDNIIYKPTKTSKADAIKTLETSGNSAVTLVWNYISCGWYIGENVAVVGTGSNKYLRSNPDKQVTDNLAHLINYGYVYHGS